MVYQITSDNIEMSASMKSLAEEKLSKLENHLRDIPEDLKTIRVVLNTAPDDQFVARVEASVYGKVYVAEESSVTLENALIEAVENVDRQYLKEKSKREDEDWKERREMKESFVEDSYE
jgi:ribosomal subunit interface protein